MIKNILFLFSLAIFSIGITSCNDCIGPFGKEKVVCNNGGTCNEGECDCLKGYSGATCDSLDLCELNDIECVYGDCIDGDCFCQDGYEGELCETETRLKFLGQYNITTEGCIGLDTLGSFQMTIERNFFDGARIEITNVFNAARWDLNGFFSKIEAEVNSGANSFDIFNQSPDDNEKTISGTGTLDLSDTTQIKIIIDYTVVNGNKSYSCSLEGTKVE